MRIITLIFALFIVIPGYTQTSQYDSARSIYIREIEDRFYIKPLITVKSLSLILTDENEEARDISYLPSSSNFLGLGFYLFDVGFEASFRLPQNEEEVPSEIFGKTKSFDFQTNIYSKRWGADIAYQKYSRLYLDSPSDHYNLWRQGDPYPLRDDLEIRYLQANGFYIFNNEKFSFRSPYIQSEQQLSSRGSVLAGLFFSDLKVRADSSLLPLQTSAFYQDVSQINKVDVTAIAVNIGYTYTLTFKNFYANGTIALGPGHFWTSYGQNNQEESITGIRPVVNFRAALGYNGNWFFCGLTAFDQIVSAKVSNLSINSNSANVKLFIGFRFREKGILKKSVFQDLLFGKS